MDRAKLVEMVKKLNECGVLDKKLNVVAKTADLASAFIKAVASVPDEIEGQIPDDVILFYNDAVVESKTKEDKVKPSAKPTPKAVAPKAAVKAPAKKAAAKAPAKATPKAAVKAPAKKTGESNASKIEAMVMKGGKTLEQMVEVTGGKISSTRNKIQVMRNSGIKIVTRDGKYYVEE